MSEEQWKRDAEDAKRLGDVMYMKAMKEDPIATSEWSVHLLFDHYLIWAKDRNTFIVNGGNQGALDFEDKVNDLIRKVIESQQGKGEERQNVAGQIVEPPNRDEWVNWGRK
jgi:hypothetical protein